MNLGFYSYLSAAIAFGFFAVLLLFSVRASLQGMLLAVAAATTTLWAGVAATVAIESDYHLGWYRGLEVARYIAWYVFLLRLFDPAAARSSASG